MKMEPKQFYHTREGTTQYEVAQRNDALELRVGGQQGGGAGRPAPTK